MFAAGVFVFAGLLSSTAVFADQAVWEWNKYNYYVNSGSFVNNIVGESLTGDQARFWVKYAGSVWPVRTGAHVIASYVGTTALECYDHDSASHNKDGYNVVSALPGCKDGGTNNCEESGFAPRWRSGLFGTGPWLTEADVCISNSNPSTGGPDDWEVMYQGVNTTESDLVHVLIHEFGHLLVWTTLLSSVRQGLMV